MKSQADQVVALALERTKKRGQLQFFTEGAGREFFDACLEAIEELARDRKVRLPIGAFRYTTHVARESYDPKTKGRRPIPAQRKLKFTAAKKFRGLK